MRHYYICSALRLQMPNLTYVLIYSSRAILLRRRFILAPILVITITGIDVMILNIGSNAEDMSITNIVIMTITAGTVTKIYTDTENRTHVIPPKLYPKETVI